MTTFKQALQQPKPLLLDGATGTELTRRGIPTPIPLWSAAALKTHPQVVKAIHVDYLQAGADIITTNTFRTHARNVGEEARALTLTAVKLAQAAAAEIERPVWVAGSVAPLEDCYSPHLTPDAATCQREHQQLIDTLAEGGVDFFLIETMNTIHEAHAAAYAASQTDMPFVVSFVLDEDYHLLSGESLADAVHRIAPLDPAAILINCIPTRHISTALQQLKNLTDLPMGAYGNMGTPEDVQGWAFEGEIPPDDYCEHAAAWLALGAKFIGSCCGSEPSHTAAMRQLIDQL